MKEYSHALSLLELPFYAFDLKNFWMSYSRNFGSNKSLEFKVPVNPVSDLFVLSTILQALQHRSKLSEDGISAAFSSDLSEPMLFAGWHRPMPSKRFL